MTLFWRDWVVAVRVDIRGRSAPAETDGWIVVRLTLLRLLVRANADLRGDSAVLVVVFVGDCCCPALPLTILVSRPGPIDFRGGFAAAGAGTGTEVVAVCVMELCRLFRSDDTDDCARSLDGDCC